MFETIKHNLLTRARERVCRETSPPAAVLDSQSVETVEAGGPRSMMEGEGPQTHAPVGHRWTGARAPGPRRFDQDRDDALRCSPPRAKPSLSSAFIALLVYSVIFERIAKLPLDGTAPIR